MNFLPLAFNLQRTFLEMLPLYLDRTMGTKVQSKKDGTLVGDLDRITLARLTTLIKKQFPADIVLGEEDKRSPEELKRIITDKTRRQWTVDGLDGTGNRNARSESFGAMVSCRLGDEILFAAAFRPVQEKLYGDGFFFSTELGGTWQMAGDSMTSLRTISRPEILPRRHVMLEGKSTRFGSPPISNLISTITTRSSFSSSVAATTVIMGKASAMVTVGNMPWDNWPAIGLIQGAHGFVTDHQGNRRKLHDCGNMIAAANMEDLMAVVKTLNRGL